MKDKLVKHNHKFSYFIMRKFAIVMMAVVAVGGAITIPTYISLNTQTANSGKAEEKSKSESPSSSSSILDEEN